MLLFLSKIKEKRGSSAKHAKAADNHWVYDVVLLLVDYDVEYLECGACYTLEDVVDSVGLRVTVELEAEDLAWVGVDSAVLETPEEAHEVGEPAEFPEQAEGEGHGGHGHHDQDVHKAGCAGAEAVHDGADEEAAEDLTHTEKDHS